MSSALRSRIHDSSAVGENKYHCVMEFDAGFTGFAGHFEGNPIVPGVCLIEAARVIAEEAATAKFRTVKIAQCRFRRPVIAGESADVTLKFAPAAGPESRKIQAEFRVGDAVSAQLKMELETI